MLRISPTFRRIILGLLIVLALLFTAGFLFARFWLDDYVKEKLISSIDQSSQQMYALQMDKLHVNIFTGSAKATGVQIHTDSLRWASLRQSKPDSTPLNIDLQLASVAIRYFHWGAYWRNKELKINGIEIVEPQLKIISVKDTVLEKDPKTDTLTKNMLDQLPQLIAPLAKSLTIGSVAIRNGKVAYRTEHPRGVTYQQADSIDWYLMGMNIVPSDTSETGKALYANNIMLTIRNVELYPANDVYAYRVKVATVIGQEEVVKLEGVTILPKISDAEFIQRLKFRKPRLRITAAEVVVRKLNLFRALHKKEWTMESVTVESARINIFQNKNLPLKRNKRMPNEMFRSINSYLNIDTILIRNSHILYTEVKDDGKGLLEFDNANGVILNVSNDRLKMSDTTPARIYARAELMGAGKLDVSLNLPLLAGTFRCNYLVNLGKMDMTYLNRLLTDKDNLRIESGDAENVILKARVQDGVAQGTLEATYNNLKLSVLQDDTGKKKKFISAIANLIIRGNNDRENTDRPFKVGEVYYRREPDDGFIRFLWRSAQSGLMKTLIPGNLKLEKKKE